MLIRIENKGITKSGYAEMCVVIKKSEDKIPNEVYFIAALNAMQDSDKLAFLRALEAFFEHELEQDDDKE